MVLADYKEVPDCQKKLTQNDVDKSLVAILKQIPGTIKAL